MPSWLIQMTPSLQTVLPFPHRQGSSGTSDMEQLLQGYGSSFPAYGCKLVC